MLLYSFGFSQSSTQLNISKNKNVSAGEKLKIQNLPAHLSVVPFILNKSIRSNVINVGDNILFNFEKFQNKEAVVTYKRKDINDVTSYICKFKDFQFAQAFISVSSKEYLISIDIPELNRKLVTYISDNRLDYYLVDLDTSKLDYLECDDSLLDLQHEEHSVENKEIPLQGKDSNINSSDPKESLEELLPSNDGAGCNNLGENDYATAKVLLLYTQAALTFAGSQDGMNNLIAQSITRANNASINSNLGLEFVLAHSELTTYEKATAAEGGSSTDLDRLRSKTDGFMDNVHTLRDTYAADFVHLFSLINDTGGLGYLLKTKYGQDNLGFALTRVQQLSSTDTFIHEIGHNMGAAHASGQTVQQGPTQWTNWLENTWSAGWRFQGSSNNYYCSLMAYESGTYWPDGKNSVRISYFSTPLLFFQGQPIGNEISGDNARSLKITKHVVSWYRDESTAQFCSASGNNASTLNLAISNINLNGLTNPSGWNSFNNFTYKRTCLIQGQTYPLTVNVAGGFSGAKLWVWVDWNNDFDFDDPDEVVLNSLTGETLQYNVNVTPPASAFIGPVRMRIRYESETSNPASSPCGISLFGEVEDYTIFVEQAGTIEEDTDGDGVADNSDLDSDNDGILDGVEGKGAAIVNAALSGLATQSSTEFGAVASRAIDGETNGILSNDSVTSTGNVLSTEYWQVDLSQTLAISEIVFFNRSDCCANQISNVYILIADSPFPSDAADLAGALSNADFTFQFPTNDETATISLPINKIGRYVRLQKSGNNTDNSLSIAEFQVFGQFVLDTDGDGRPNHLDLDSDNDGIPDNVEAQDTADYLPPAIDTPATYLANSGINSTYVVKVLNPVDSDGDGIPDYLDADSDNDGLTDLLESFDPTPAGIVGLNGMIADAEITDNYTDVSGLAYNGTFFTLLDTDNDVINGADYDYRDIALTQSFSGTQFITSLISTNLVPTKLDAYLSIISVNLGVVITRVNGASLIINPVEGMIVYDTSDNIFKVNTTGTAAGWRAFGN